MIQNNRQGQLSNRTESIVVTQAKKTLFHILDRYGLPTLMLILISYWGATRVAEPLIVNLAAQSPEQIMAPKSVPAAALDEARALGEAMANGLDLGVF